MKYIIVAIIGLLGLFAVTQVKGSERMIGDANCDGKITATDALQLLRYSAGLDSIKSPVCGSRDELIYLDADCDGKRDGDDPLYILRYVAHLPLEYTYPYSSLQYPCSEVGQPIVYVLSAVQPRYSLPETPP